MKTIVADTYTVQLFMAGDIETAKRALRKECYPPNAGLCVTIEPTTFVYTAGEESGFVVTLRNYPRFPSEPAALEDRAKKIAVQLLAECCQWLCLLVAADQTIWLTLRPEDQEK